MGSPERAIGSPMLQVRGASAEGSRRGTFHCQGPEISRNLTAVSANDRDNRVGGSG